MIIKIIAIIFSTFILTNNSSAATLTDFNQNTAPETTPSINTPTYSGFSCYDKKRDIGHLIRNVHNSHRSLDRTYHRLVGHNENDPASHQSYLRHTETINSGRKTALANIYSNWNLECNSQKRRSRR